MMQEKWLGIFVHVNVAELNNLHPVKDRGQSGQRHVVMRDFDPVTRNLA